MTVFTLDGYVLEAMRAFTATTRGCTGHPVLQEVLCEVTPDAVRLVATDTHVLGLLHLTPLLGYHLDIQCDAPCRLVLPLSQCLPLLRERSHPVTLSLDSEQVTLTAPSGLSVTLPGLHADEFPHYPRVLALDTPLTPTVRTAYDLALLGRFAAFAKAMGQPPHCDLALHGTLSPVSVRIAGLTGFYGILMPRQLAYEEAIPAWLLPPQAALPRVIHLHDLEGSDMYTGTDEAGCVWSQFLVDALAEQAPGLCAICGATLHHGWHCLDGGEEVCDDHVTWDDDAVGHLSQSIEVPIPA